MQVQVNFNVVNDDGTLAATIGASYTVADWDRVMAFEQAVLPPMIAALFDLGKTYAQSK